MTQSKISFIPTEWLWLVEVGACLVLIAILSFLARKILRKRKNLWWVEVGQIIYLPIQVALWGVGISLILDILSIHFGLTRMSLYVHHIALTFVVICISWLALRWVIRAFHVLARKSEKLGITLNTVRALSKLSTVVIIVLMLLVLFQIYGFNIMPLLAFGGIGMAGIAFAAQDVIANFFGGVMLHFAHPFEIGDTIEIPAQNNFQGRIKEIGWYGTVIRDLDKREVFFPNALFTKTYVLNLSRRTHNRVIEKISISYSSLEKAQAFVEHLRKTLGHLPKIDKTQGFFIALQAFTPTGAELLIDILSTEKDTVLFYQIRQEILLITSQLAEEGGISILPMSHVMNYSRQV